MCYVFMEPYAACQHLGQPEYRPCGISHCPKVTVCLGDVQEALQDFCPEVLPRRRLQSKIAKAYAVYRLMDITSHRWSSEREHAKVFYNRAARFHKDTSGANDILAFMIQEEEMLNAAKAAILLEILETLLRDFWVRTKYNLGFPQPTLAERMLITQLCKVRECESIKATMQEFQRKADASQALSTIVPDAEADEIRFCHICHETFGTADEYGRVEHCVKTNLCNHKFGNVCLAAWFNSIIDWTCPMCRRELVPDVLPQQPIADENAIQDGGRIKFTDLRGEMVQISKPGTPEWMIALLDGTETEDGENLRPYLRQHDNDAIDDAMHDINMYVIRF